MMGGGVVLPAGGGGVAPVALGGGGKGNTEVRDAGCDFWPGLCVSFSSLSSSRWKISMVYFLEHIFSTYSGYFLWSFNRSLILEFLIQC